jgi:hypothetical protein
MGGLKNVYNVTQCGWASVASDDLFHCAGKSFCERPEIVTVRLGYHMCKHSARMIPKIVVDAQKKRQSDIIFYSFRVIPQR